MPEKASGWLKSHMRSCDVFILALKKAPKPENFSLYQPRVGVSALIE
jgi:hypothetical protein